MKINLYNSLAKKVEEFVPIEQGKVRLYTCGPTVYDNVHIGNLRTFVFNDILKRTLILAGYRVHHVMNITDFGHLVGDAEEGEDKMTKGLRREGRPLTVESMLTFAGEYMQRFEEDMSKLNLLPPTDGLIRASDHVSEDIELIRKLEEKGVTYQISTGLYFDTSTFPEYGKLGKVKLGETSGARIAVNTEKRNPQDFVLWRTDPKLGWESVWGRGFPGWHIECSAMAMKYLGETLDLHTGGIDLLPTHHNNEIAQSETTTGKPFVRYWLHGEHLQVEGGRMGKSEGNAFTLRNIEEKGFSPLDYRYLILGTHYRQQQNFTWEALESARRARMKLSEQFAQLPLTNTTLDRKLLSNFEDALCDDLNTPRALAAVWELMKSDGLKKEDKRGALLEMDKVLGLKFEAPPQTAPDNVLQLIKEREEMKKKRDWQAADQIRLRVEESGYTVRDTENGPLLYPKS